jgi:hypothetical protein
MTSLNRRQKIVLVIILLATIFGLTLTARQQLRQRVYVIPAGTAAGKVTVDFPLVIELTVGVEDVLIIDNQDEVMHNFGPFSIAPHTQLTQEFDRPMEFQGVCTFHANQQMTLRVNPAPWYIFW